MNRLFPVVSDLHNLYRAWRNVRAQAWNTQWPEITAQIEELDVDPIRALRQIRQQLRDGRYVFSPKWGYAKRKSGGSRRGITVHSISDRIVQRSILNVLYTQDPDLQKSLGDIPRSLQTPTSFAGYLKRSVPEAIAVIQKEIRGSARAYAYSDIKDFFPRVPRREVLDYLSANINDDRFLSLFESALETEILNLDDVRPWADLFPLAGTGVAQGSLLSVFVGNLALRHFDARLNRLLVTIRYLDDFVILGPTLDAVAAGFREAQDELAKLKMTCYEPHDGSQKSFLGPVADGFDFLGCRVHPDGVSPSRKSQRKLLRGIASLIAAGKQQIRDLQTATARRRTEPAFAQTLLSIDLKIRGWGDAYRFVSNRLPFAQMDVQIDRLLTQFSGWFHRQGHQASPSARRRMQGVALLADTPPVRKSNDA